MAQSILLKRSSVAGNVPDSSDLSLGEIAINTADGAVYIKKGNNDIVAVHDNDILHIDTTNSRIGIGTTSPSHSLDVHSGTNDWPIRGISTDAKAGIVLADNNTVNYIMSQSYTLSLGNQPSLHTSNLNIKSTGKVGIGTTSPSKRLHIVDSAAHQLQLQGSNSYWNVGTGWSGYYQDYFLVANNSGEKMVIDTNGNVGIGTNGPAEKLDVVGTGKVRGTGDGSAVLKLGQKDNSASAELVTIYTDDAGSTRSLGGDALEFFTSRYLQNIGATRSSAAGSPVRTWKFATTLNSDERGTDLTLYNQADASASGSTTTTADVLISSLSNRASYIDTGANFGLGTSSPAQKLDVRDGDITTRDSSNTNYAQLSRYVGLILKGNGTGARGVKTPNTDALTLGTNDTERVRITSSGNLKFTSQTTNFESPGFTYHTNNYLYLRGGSAGLILADDSNANTIQIIDGSSGYINFETGDGTSKMRILANGSVGIGTTSPTGAKLHVAGGVKATDLIAHDSTGINLQTDEGTKRLVVADNGVITFNQAYSFPTSDGSANQVLKTDGSGNLTFATVSGAGSVSTMSDSDGDTKIQVEESSDEDIIRFDTAGTERMLISASGDVSMNRRLYLSGTGQEYIQSAGSLRIDIDHDNNQTDRIFVVSKHNASTELMRVQENGNVGIGETSPGQKLQVNGNIRADGHYYVGGNVVINSSRIAKMANGTATAPAYTFNDDDNTGMYRISADTLGFTTNAKERLHIDNSGNVIVNGKLLDADINVPNQNLLDINSIKISNRDDIYGNATKTVIDEFKATYANDGTGATTVRIYVDDGILVDGENYTVSVYYEGLVGTLSLDWCDQALTGNHKSITGTSSNPASGRLYGYASRSDYTSTYRFLDINLSQGSSDVVTLFHPKVEEGTNVTDFVGTERTNQEANSKDLNNLNITGKVGVGTIASGSNKVHVAGPNSAPQILVENTSAAGSHAAKIQFKPSSSRSAGPFIMSTQRGAASNDGDIQIGDDGGTIATFNAGKVGIGTGSPPSTFTVNVTSSNDGVELQSSTTKIATLARTAVGGQVVASLDGVSTRPIHVGGIINEDVILANAGGDVGIGTASPSQKLSVNGNIYSIGGFVNASGYQLNGTYIVDSSRNLVNIAAITTSGNVTVGGNLTVNGTTTTLNTATLSVDDLNITVADGAANAAAANGAGLTVDGANATLTYTSAQDEWNFNKNLVVGGKETTASFPLMVKSNSAHQGLHIEENSGAESWQMGVDADGDFNFYNSGSTTPSITFDDSNNVGIGTATPSFQLHVLSTIGTRTLSLGHGVSSGTLTTDAAKPLNFQQAGSTKMTLTSGGNLDLYGNMIIRDTAGTRGIFRNNDAYDLRLGGGVDMGDGAYISLGGENRGGPTSSARGKVEIFAGGNAFANQADILGDIVLGASWNGGSDSIINIDSSAGKVGIGTNSPSEKLHVSGNLKLTGNIHLNGTATGNNGISYGTGTTQPSVWLWGEDHASYPGQVHIVGRSDNAAAHSGEISFWDYTGSTWNQNMVIKKSGQVGIGASSPLSGVKLDVRGGNIHVGGYGASGNNYGIRFSSDDTSSHWHIYSDSGGELAFGRSGTVGDGEKVRFDASGRVGIGTNNPEAALHISGTSAEQIKLQRTNHDTYRIGLQSAVGLGFHNVTDGRTDMIISGAGRVGIGTTSVNAKLHIDPGTDFSKPSLIINSPSNYSEGDLYVLHGRNVNTGIGFSSTAFGVNVQEEIPSDNIPQLRSNTGGLTSAGLIYVGADEVNQGIFGVMGATGTAGTDLIHRFTVRSDGKVGIGTTSPAGIFQVGSATGGNFIVGNSATSTNNRHNNSNHIATFQRDSNAFVQIASGNNTSNTGIKFTGAGDRGSVYGTSGYDIHIEPNCQYGVGDVIIKGKNESTYQARVGIGTTSPAAKLQVEEYGIDTTTTSSSATTQIAIHTFAAATFRSARFTVQVTNSTDSTYHTSELLLVHDGTTANITEFGEIHTGSAVEATFDCDVNSGNVRLLATPASTDTMAFKVVCHSITT